VHLYTVGRGGSWAVSFVGHGGSFTAEVSDSERLRTPKVELGLFPYVY